MSYNLRDYTKFLYEDNYADVMSEISEDETVIDTSGVYIHKNIYKRLYDQYTLVDSDPEIQREYKRDRTIEKVYDNKDLFFNLTQCVTENDIKELISRFKENTLPLYLSSKPMINTCITLLLIADENINFIIDDNLLEEFFRRCKSLFFSYNGFFDTIAFKNFIEKTTEFTLLDKNELIDIQITEDGFFHPVENKFIPFNKIYNYLFIPKDFGNNSVLAYTKTEGTIYNNAFKSLMYKYKRDSQSKVRTLKDIWRNNNERI